MNDCYNLALSHSGNLGRSETLQFLPYIVFQFFSGHHFPHSGPVYASHPQLLNFSSSLKKEKSVLPLMNGTLVLLAIIEGNCSEHSEDKEKSLKL